MCRSAKVERGREDRPVSEGSKDNVSMRERERDRVEACLAQVSGYCDERNSRC